MKTKTTKNCGSCGKPVQDDADPINSFNGITVGPMVFHKDAVACAEAKEYKAANPFRGKVTSNYGLITYTQLQYSGD